MGILVTCELADALNTEFEDFKTNSSCIRVFFFCGSLDHHNKALQFFFISIFYLGTMITRMTSWIIDPRPYQNLTNSPRLVKISNANLKDSFSSKAPGL
jgi:hypothetical protein